MPVTRFSDCSTMCVRVRGPHTPVRALCAAMYVLTLRVPYCWRLCAAPTGWVSCGDVSPCLVSLPPKVGVSSCSLLAVCPPERPFSKKQVTCFLLSSCHHESNKSGAVGYGYYSDHGKCQLAAPGHGMIAVLPCMCH